MPRNAIQSKDYKFTVKQEPIIHRGKDTGFFGNFREDNGVCLGITSEQYSLVQNSELLDAAEEALANRGLVGFERKIIVAGAGERFYASFTFRNKQIATQVGDVFGYSLLLKNSFDRTLRAAFELGFERLICKNGMSTLEREFNISARHAGKVAVEFVTNAVDKALEHGAKALQVYDLLAAKAITEQQGQNILAQLEAAKILSGSLRQSMETLWLAPRRAEDRARNLYNLYNAVTEHLTHQVSGERFEYAGKVGNNVLIKLYNAARHADQLSKLILPVTNGPIVTVS